MALALGLYVLSWKSQVAPALRWAGRKEEIQARVLDYPEERYGRYYYRLRVAQVGGEGVQPFTLRLSAAQPLYSRPYDQVVCTVSFYTFASGGPFSQQGLRLAGGCQLGGYLSGAGGKRTAPAAPSLGKWLAEARRSLYRSFAKLLPPEEAALMQAMVLGRRDSLDQGSYEDFRLTGCAHLLVVSGLHMGVLSALASQGLGALGLGRIPRNLLAAGCLLLFLCVSGFPVSAVRACAMHLAYLLGGCIGRRPDGVNSLGLALLLICLQNPFSGGDLGLALSTFATLGIITLGPGLAASLLKPLGRFPQAYRLAKPAASALAVTLSAMAFTAPFQLAAFGGFSLLSPLANLLLAAPCTLLLYCAFFTALFSMLPGLSALALPFGFCGGWAARAALWLAESLARIPHAYVYLGLPGLAMLGFLFLLLTIPLLPGRKHARLTALCLALLVLWGGLWEGWRSRDLAAVAVAGEGESASVILVQNRRAAVLRLGSHTGTALSLLRQNNVRQVDTIFLTGSGSGERQAAWEVLGAYPVGQVVLPQGAYPGGDLSPGRTGTGLGVAVPGQGFQALPGVEAVLSPTGARLAFTVNGAAFAVEWGPSGPGSCQCLITTEKASTINSPFTVLLADGIIEGKYVGGFWQGVPAGAYCAPSEGGLRLEVRPGPSMALVP